MAGERQYNNIREPKPTWGHKDTGELYWDGRKVIVQRPITLGVFERVLASGAAVSALGVMIVEVGRSAGWWGG